jgi:peptide/nickel transport system substrate-binding protein
MSNTREHRMTRRELLKWLGVSAVVPAVAACVAPSAPGTIAPNQGVSEDSSASNLAADQTLRVVGRSFSRYDPAIDASGFNSMFIQHIWMTPFMLDGAGTPHPWLATGYEANDELTTYTIHLDPRAVWSDGSPVLAQEAKDYWTWGLSPDCAGCYLSSFGAFPTVQGAQEVIDGNSHDLSGVVVVDDKTLQFNLTGPDPIFIQRMALMDTGFAKMEDVARGPNYAADGAVRVNGPFKIKVWDETALQFELEQNPLWWGDKKPSLTRIIAQNAADENISMLQWQNDEVDAMLLLSSLRFQLRDSDPDSFIPIPQPICLYYTLHQSRPPTDDINVRRALIHAVDWQQAIAAAWEGNYNDRLMRGLLTPEMSCYRLDQWPDLVFDPELARQELAASRYGSADGLELIRITPGGQSPNYIRVAEIMMEQWSQNLGITNVEMRVGTLDAWGQDAELVQVRRRSWGGLMPDPGNYVRGFYDIFTAPSSGGELVADAELEAMFAEMQMMSREDPAYCEMVQEIERRILATGFVTPMIWDLWQYNVKPWVKGVESNMQLGWNTLLDVYIAEH